MAIYIKTKSDLLNLTKSLKKQFTQDKIIEQNLYHDIIKVFKPLIEPLSKIVDETKQTRLAIKDIPHEKLESIEGKPVEKLPLPSSESNTVVGHIALNFLRVAWKPGNEYDKAYGIRWDGSKFMLGNKKVDILGNDLKIGDKVYEGTT